MEWLKEINKGPDKFEIEALFYPLCQLDVFEDEVKLTEKTENVFTPLKPLIRKL